MRRHSSILHLLFFYQLASLYVPVSLVVVTHVSFLSTLLGAHSVVLFRDSLSRNASPSSLSLRRCIISDSSLFIVPSPPSPPGRLRPARIPYFRSPHLANPDLLYVLAPGILAESDLSYLAGFLLLSCPLAISRFYHSPDISYSIS